MAGWLVAMKVLKMVVQLVRWMGLRLAAWLGER